MVWTVPALRLRIVQRKQNMAQRSYPWGINIEIKHSATCRQGKTQTNSSDLGLCGCVCPRLTYSLCCRDAQFLCCDLSTCVGQISLTLFCPEQVNMDALTPRRITQAHICLWFQTLKPQHCRHFEDVQISDTQTHTKKESRFINTHTCI